MMSKTATSNQTKPIDPMTPLVQLPSPNVVLSPTKIPAANSNVAAKWSVAMVLGVVRRRWFLVLCLGLPLAALAAYGAWELIPAPHTAFTDIRIRSHVATAPGNSNGPHAGPQHKELKATHMQLITDREVISVALNEKGVAQLETLRDVDDQREWMQKYLKVTNRGTEFFRVEVKGLIPDDLKRILRAVVNAYFTKVVGTDRKDLERRFELYRGLRDTRKAGLTRRRATLKAIAEATAPNQTQLDQKQLAMLERQAVLQKQIDDIESDIFELKLVIDYRKSNPNKIKVDAKIVNDLLAVDPEHKKLKKRADELQERHKYFQERLGKGHPNLKLVRENWKKALDELAALEKKKEAEIRQNVLKGTDARHQQTIEQLEERVRFQERRKKAIEEKLGSIEIRAINNNKVALDIEDHKNAVDRMEADVQALEKLVTHLEAELSLREKQPRIDRWGEPETTNPDRKKQIIGTAAAGFGAFGLVLFAIGFVDVRSRRLNSVNQVVETVGIPLLGAVPLIPKMATARKNGKWSSRARYWHGAMTESIDATRTVLLSDAVGQRKILMVTSAAEFEGKTTTACHLATSLARAGNHVLLVDADMRRPSVHRTFDLEPFPGLAEVIRGEVVTDEAIQPSGIARMPVLAAGEVDAQTLEFLAQGQLEKLTKGWRNTFDFVVIDTPPILPIADGLVIAQHVDGVVFTVRRDVSRVNKVVAACQRLSLIGVPLLGVVGIGLDHDNYGYHGYSYYGYGADPR